ncbi:MAG: hypothetical protein ACFE9S_00420 [Candidatus Hermodarchaeota archaeon]
MNKIKRVLFVCLGNTARSPAAEYLARYHAKKMDADLEFDSCGFFNAFNYMQPESQKYLNEKNIKHPDFKPKIINRRLLEKQDLILTMESSHSKDIITNFADLNEIENKTFTLKEFNGESRNFDIIDPYYTSNETYREVLRIIDKQVESAIKKIINMNKSKE